MRRLSVTIAVFGFFAMAAVGWFSGVPPLTCGIRALMGAVVLYVVVTVAGRIVVNIMVDTLIRGSSSRDNARGAAREQQQ